MTCNIPYFIAGDPDLQTTLEMMLEVEPYVKAIVVGFPFSDPMAGGVEIQKANVRALENMIHTTDIFMMLKKFKEESDCPIVVELYFNQIFTFGIERFFEEASKSNVQAITVLDLPMEHENEIAPYAKKTNINILHTISNISQKRLEKNIEISKSAVICLNKETYQQAKGQTDLHLIQEVHNLSDEIYSKIVIYKEPIVDLIEVLGLDERSRQAVKIQLKTLLM